MPERIPDLWPPSIRLDVASPLVILKTQAELLSGRTSGLLECAVTTNEEGDSVVHSLDLIARAVGFRERIFTAAHEKGLPYPVTVDGIGILATCVQTEEHFICFLGKSLQSDVLLRKVQALVARINDEKPHSPPQAPESGA